MSTAVGHAVTTFCQVGSGLILLVIVGTWLAVLVPMGLRSHDGHPSRSVERLGDAVRVLVRRSADTDPREELPVPAGASRRNPLRSAAGAVKREVGRGRAAVTSHRRQPLLGRSLTLSRAVDRVGRLLRRQARRPGTSTGWRHRSPVSRATMLWRRREPAQALSPAVRRRRVLSVILLVAVGSLLGGQVGPGWLHAVGGAALTLALLVVVDGRRHAAAHADRARRRAELRRFETRQRPDARPADARVAAARVAAERRPATREAAAPLRPAAPSPATAGREWQPVPVPLPTYVGKAVAPARPVVVADLPVELVPAIDEPAEESDDILERRRAVGGW